MQFWSWPLNSCFVILSRAIWPHTQIYEQFCIESYCILYMFLNYSNLRLQWEGDFCVSLLLPDQQGTFSVCRWQKEVFPSTRANNSTWGIYISSCSDYEERLWQRSWWVEVLEYKIERRCYFVSPASTSSYFSKWKWKWKWNWVAMLLCKPWVHQFIFLKELLLENDFLTDLTKRHSVK